MKRLIKNAALAAAVMAAGAATLLVGENAFTNKSAGFTSTADARIGRPLTPMSYAGVARRTTRRAVAAGAVVGGAAVAGSAYYAAPPVVYAPPSGACYQAVDAYGRIYTRCQ